MSVLVLAPHADDEVLGVGATIAKRKSQGKRVCVAVLTGHGEKEHPIWPKSAWETTRQECRDACDFLGVDELLFEELPAACLDHTPNWQINSTVQKIIAEVKPEELFLPFPNDLHKDHGAIAYGASVAVRPYLELGKTVRNVLFYETLTETHLAPPFETAFQPNYFIDVSDHIDKKLTAFSRYQSQIQSDDRPRSVRGLATLASYRGLHIGVAAAEAFVVFRMVE